MNLYDEALKTFTGLFEKAKQSGLVEPTAMTLATVSADGRPSARTVLLKEFDNRGFVFYTNYQSRKGLHLLAEPKAALCFYWMPLERQVLIEGAVESVDGKEADAYWATRPRESQLGAWASDQSRPLESREALEEKLRLLAAKFGSGAIPRPEHWSGFRVVPDRIEFWKAMPSRLHERWVFEKKGADWTKTLLNP